MEYDAKKFSLNILLYAIITQWHSFLENYLRLLNKLKLWLTYRIYTQKKTLEEF